MVAKLSSKYSLCWAWILELKLKLMPESSPKYSMCYVLCELIIGIQTCQYVTSYFIHTYNFKSDQIFKSINTDVIIILISKLICYFESRLVILKTNAQLNAR